MLVAVVQIPACKFSSDPKLGQLGHDFHGMIIENAMILNNTHKDIILAVLLPLTLLHFTPFQANSVGKHGSPIQFFFIPYSILIAIMVSTSMDKRVVVLKFHQITDQKEKTNNTQNLLDNITRIRTALVQERVLNSIQISVSQPHFRH